MNQKSNKRLRLEESLREDPDDPFLRYGLGVQCLRDDDPDAGRAILESLIADHPNDQVAALQQLGQSYRDEGDIPRARDYFGRGIALADRLGDAKASAEMRGFLALLD